MLQKGGQISKTTEISPVLCVQPFHTCCLTCNRRQSLFTAYRGRYSRKNVTETNTKYKLEVGNGEKLKHSHIANKLSPNLLRRTQCLPQKSSLPSLSSQPASKHNGSREICQKQNFSRTSVPPIPTKTSLSPEKIFLCQNRGHLPLNKDFVPNTDTILLLYIACHSPLTYPGCPEALYSLQLCC